MLTKYQRLIAGELADSLLESGMLFGEELEWYLRLNINCDSFLKCEEQYFEFEEQVLKYVEKKTRFVKVLDVETNKVEIYNEVSEFANELGVTTNRVTMAISGKNLMMKRYKIEYIKISVRELMAC